MLALFKNHFYFILKSEFELIFYLHHQATIVSKTHHFTYFKKIFLFFWIHYQIKEVKYHLIVKIQHCQINQLNFSSFRINLMILNLFVIILLIITFHLNNDWTSLIILQKFYYNQFYPLKLYFHFLQKNFFLN